MYVPQNLCMSHNTFTIVCRELCHYIEKQVTNGSYIFVKSININIIIYNYIGHTLAATHFCRRKGCCYNLKLATIVEYRTLSELFGLGKATVGRIVVETCQAISKYLLPKYVNIPQGNRLKEVVDGFELCWGFLQAAGAIDGSHIPIVLPQESASDYYNRKGYYSVIMQGLVDFCGLFMNIYVGWPGKVNDARVFVNSSLYQKGMSNTLLPNWKSLWN